MAQYDWLTSLTIRGGERRKSREWAHLANAGDFNRRYPTCQISAILYADRGDRRKSQSLHRAHLAIIADRGDRLIKSPSVSSALVNKKNICIKYIIKNKPEIGITYIKIQYTCN